MKKAMTITQLFASKSEDAHVETDQSSKAASQVTCMFVDNGLFTEMAVKLAQTYKKVYYCPSWSEAFPRINRGMIGDGMEGLTIVAEPLEVPVENIDLYVFPDLNYGYLQVYLRSLGKPVWGSGLGEEMEQDRVAMKQLIPKLGLPLGAYKVVRGLSELREYLNRVRDVHVKISKWRGTFESRFIRNPIEAESWLDHVAGELGYFKDTIDFVVEDHLPDKIELGLDEYTVDGEYPTRLLAGLEIKDQGYIGVFKSWKQMPKPMVQVSEALDPVFRKLQYRGFYSTEVRIGKDQKPYLIDMTCRAPSPPNELYQEFYTNLADIVWKGAQGKMVDPIPLAKFGAQIRLHSQWAARHWQPVEFPKEMRRQVKLTFPVLTNGRMYVVPQTCEMAEIGSTIGWGDTMEDAIDHAAEAASSVHGYDIEINIESIKAEMERQIEEGEKHGVRVFT